MPPRAPTGQSYPLKEDKICQATHSPFTSPLPQISLDLMHRVALPGGHGHEGCWRHWTRSRVPREDEAKIMGFGVVRAQRQTLGAHTYLAPHARSARRSGGRLPPLSRP